ncbi:MAG: hypothetical protein KDJ75_01575 [Alphaproteobacteria bacterium]|nr:hypothetical protein [Alphaproteobacteria bacterium]
MDRDIEKSKEWIARIKVFTDVQKLITLLEEHPEKPVTLTPDLVTFIQKCLNLSGHNIEVDGVSSSSLIAELNGFYASIGRKDLMLGVQDKEKTL